MGTAKKWLQERGLAVPLAVLALAAIVLLPLIGTYGFWEPYEFSIADMAREVRRTGDYAGVFRTRPPLTIWLAASGISAFGTTELAARLPLALLAIAGALATYGIGARLRRPRAGLLAAVVLLASPLFVFQARQLTSDVGLVASSAIAMLGLVGLAWPARSPRPLATNLADAALVVVGLALGFLAGGLVLGVFVPLAGLAVASAAAGAAGFADDSSPPRGHHLTVAAIAGTAALVAIGIVLTKWGHKGYLKTLGGAWRTGAAAPTATFDYIIDQVAYGMFPWSALAPLAVMRLCIVRRPDRNAWGGLLLVAWAAVAYAIATLWVRKVGDLRFFGVVPIAVAVGVMLDDVIAAKVDGDPSRAPSAVRGLPLAALFVALAAIQLGRDVLEFPDELASLHLLAVAKYPKETGLTPIVLGFGVAFAIAAAIGLWVAPTAEGEDGRVASLKRLGRHGLFAAVGLSYAFALFLAVVFTPRLSEHFSIKNVFTAYFDHRGGKEPLGIMGVTGSAPEYYAQGKAPLEKVQNREALLALLRRPERVFAVAPTSEVCPVHQAAGKGGFPVHIAFAGNSRYYLFTNQLAAGARDSNPLLTALRRTPPDTIRVPLNATFVPPGNQKGKIELLGYDMPREVVKGQKFKMTLYYAVHEQVSTGYKVFVHFDRGVRFQGDHEPVGGLCGTQHWQAGDYVVDTFEVTAGELTHPKGTYQVYVGFFTGSAGNWRNMDVTSGNADKNNRVHLGAVQVGSSKSGCVIASPAER